MPHLRSIIARWRHLVPEIGRLCERYAPQAQKELVRVYIDHHRPAWWPAWNVETAWRNECPFEFPTLSMEVFQARASILRETGEELERYLAIPWCRADLYFIEKLVLCLEAYGSVRWEAVQ